MDLDITQLRSLIEMLTELDVAEFEHESEGRRVKVVRGARVAVGGPAFYAPSGGAAAPGPSPAAAAAPAVDDGSVDVTSPFVGTFYRSPSPDAPAFVEIGTVIRPGQTLCIVEAMKLMNEIEAEFSGTILEIYAQNGKAVEFGQKLFKIKKA
ncbi:MAG: acetyl-CoA carboxylase biotin carboxyl carrier protein [Myxococcales bacterium]|jgi:acetyl-CoA carboxylase biotin carboxyl carrier protein|nr:acetyl-CoA carboxylase biotin carboxyl carrier protein [Myxococcales bacterium]